jgi:hypothetical protein
MGMAKKKHKRKKEEIGAGLKGFSKYPAPDKLPKFKKLSK